METDRGTSRKARPMKIQDRLVIGTMLALAGLGIVVGISQGDSAPETMAFVMFAMVMLYISVRW